MDIKEKWEALEREVKDCKACRLGGKYRLLDNGNRSAKVMVVDNIPSEEDLTSGEAFSGFKGHFLTELLELYDVSREEINLTYLVNCNKLFLPFVSVAGAQPCLNCLRRQFSLLKPRLVIALGEIPCRVLISPDYALDSNHGRLVKKGETFFFGTYSPDYFRIEPRTKRLTFKDFIAVKEALPPKL